MLWTPFPFLYVSSGGVGPADTRFTSSTVVTAAPPSPITSGAGVVFTATITTTGSATGTVQFYDGATPLGSAVAVSANAASTPSITTLSVGSHSISSVYSGDGTHQPSTSNTLTYVINAISSTIAVTGVPASPTTSGTGVVFTGTVTATGSPTGTIRFQDGGVDMTGFTNPVTMSGNTASTPSITTLSTATHTITGIYSGDATHSGSTSSGYTHTVNAVGYAAQVVTFGGATALTSGALTGAANTKVGLVSFWFQMTGGDGVFQAFHDTAGNLLQILRFNTGTIRVYCQGLLVMSTVGAYNVGGWHHFLAAWDLGAGVAQIYIDGVADRAASPTITDSVVGYAGETSWAAGASPGPSSQLSGKIADFYVNLAETLDITNSTNRLKFRSAGGNPVDLGSTGSIPTGTAPIIYFSGAFASWNTNKGTGGGFTVTGSALGNGGTLP